ncbi:MAG: methylmalonyl-CoA epimerase [Dehalococcoidia bacterium]|nr:methylmalonyl-CoA epimerase [Dehalococcoidia bacterium]MCA9826473.1 methylmalonyl-CoA epimerase [Dehalococcoidia bacterium]
MITRIHHVGLVVQDADEALKFWRDVIGLEVTDDRVIDDQGVRGVLLKIGNSEVELLEPTRDDTGVARFLETRGEGMHHLCFESDDVAKELETAASRGIELIDQSPRPGLAGMIGFLHPKSNHGVLVEFATPIEGAH